MRKSREMKGNEKKKKSKIQEKIQAYRDNIDTALDEVLCGFLGGVAGDTPDLEFLGELGIGENGVDNRTTLVTGGAKNSNDLGHGEGWINLL